MSLCSFSKDYEQNTVQLDKNFILNYMNDCSEQEIKVYLLGLAMSSETLSPDNSPSYMCDFLGLTEEELNTAFKGLGDKGLVNIISESPLEVQFKNIRSAYARHYKKEKYADFNTQLQSLFPSVNFANSNQYTVYYDFIEETKIKPETLIMIARYCVNLKGENIKTKYILTVAKSWIEEGVRTLEDVEEKIKQLETVNEAIRLICKAVGKKSEIDLEDKNLYIKWTSSWGFALDAILYAAKSLKNKGGFSRLDSLLDELYRNNAMSVIEIENYLNNKQAMYKLAVNVNKTLGLYYENIEYIVEKYISSWLSKGFDESTIMLVAEYCFNKSIRTLEAMNKSMLKFYAEGCVTTQAINEHLAMLMQRDMAIKKIIELTGFSRNVNMADRDMYKVWTSQWNLDYELIEYGASLCQGKPLSALNNLLAKWKSNNVYTVEQAKGFVTPSSSTPAQTQTQYTKEQLGDYFYSLDELDEIEV